MSHDVDSRHFTPEDYQVAAKMGGLTKKKEPAVIAICTRCGWYGDIKDMSPRTTTEGMTVSEGCPWCGASNVDHHKGTETVKYLSEPIGFQNIGASCSCGWEGDVCGITQEFYVIDEKSFEDACPKCGAVMVELASEPWVKFIVKRRIT